MNRDEMDVYLPTRIIFGAGRLDELATCELPGARPLVCTTKSRRPGRLALVRRVQDLLARCGIEAMLFEGVTPNPTKEEVEQAAALADETRCDFVVGLGGGSSVDAAKAVALLMEQGGDLWDYAYTGSGKGRPIVRAAPVVAITTTAGTGTETDPYSVITKTETGEKLDFAADALFPTLSIIDPELMVTLPEDFTVFQGLDAFFHASECFITNHGVHRLIDVFAHEAMSSVLRWLPVALDSPGDIKARSRLAYAADICGGYVQSLAGTTSHHLIAQTIGGFFPAVPHGASLMMIAEAYYRRVAPFVPGELEALGKLLGEAPTEGYPGCSYSRGLGRLFERLGYRGLALSDYGIGRSDLKAIADAAINRTGFDGVDRYPLTEKDVLDILMESYR